MFKESILHLTHNDLDATGTELMLLEKYLPEFEVQTIRTNYSDLSERVEALILRYQKHGAKLVFITDVSFSEHKNLLLDIQEAIPQDKIVYLDHHIYPEDFWNDFKFPKKIHEQKSATKIIQELLLPSLEEESPHLYRFVLEIDAYDLWKIDDENFDAGHRFNDYLWSKTAHERMYMAYEIHEKGFEDFEKRTDGIQKNTEMQVQKLRNSALYNAVSDISITFTDENFSWIQLQDFRAGINFCIIVNSYGIIRIRCSERIPEEVISQIKSEVLYGKSTGHLRAFVLKMPENSGMTDSIKETKRIHDIILRVRREHQEHQKTKGKEDE